MCSSSQTVTTLGCKENEQAGSLHPNWTYTTGQWRSYTRAHTGLGPCKFLRAQVNHLRPVYVPEPSGVTRNEPSAVVGHSQPLKNQAYLIIVRTHK